MNRRIICNCCQKVLKSEDGILKEECVEIRHTFGYFSKKDTKVHTFRLCEDCYDRIVSTFAVLPEEEEETELFKIEEEEC